jgi:hypothetical protein
LLSPGPWESGNVIITLFCILAAVLVFLRHRANLARLLQGTENRLQDSRAMFLLGKTVHVLALGLWFGMVVFFTLVMAPAIFQQMESLAADVDHRPAWFPLDRTTYGKVDPDINGPKEQGTRAAGYAISPLFPWFFLLQGVCGFLAAATALRWSQSGTGRRIDRVRTAVLFTALATLIIGWPLERYVDELRKPRHESVEAFLRAGPTEAAELKTKALEAKAEFALWHLLSLGLDLVTLVLVGIALALTAQLPAGPGSGAEGARNQVEGFAQKTAAVEKEMTG